MPMSMPMPMPILGLDEKGIPFICYDLIDDRIATVIPTPEAKQSTMKLTQRMVERFCAAFSGSIANKWLVLSGPNDAHQVYFHKANSFGFGGEILSATTSVWLPFHPDRLFGFLKDEQNRNLVHPLQLTETISSSS